MKEKSKEALSKYLSSLKNSCKPRPDIRKNYIFCELRGLANCRSCDDDSCNL